MTRVLASHVLTSRVAQAAAVAAAAAVVASCLPGRRPPPPPPTAGQYASLCLNDAGTNAVALTVIQYVTRSGAAGDNLRQGTGLLPAAATGVAIVSDTATCRRAAAAWRAAVAPKDASPLRPLDVVRAGPLRFVVRDPDYYNPKSEWEPYFVYDTAFVAVGGWVH